MARQADGRYQVLWKLFYKLEKAMEATCSLIHGPEKYEN